MYLGYDHSALVLKWKFLASVITEVNGIVDQSLGDTLFGTPKNKLGILLSYSNLNLLISGHPCLGYNVKVSVDILARKCCRMT